MDGQHHLHLRKRLQPYPHPKALGRFFDRMMYLVAIGGPVVFLPQALQIFISGEVAGLSLLTWILLALMNVLWTLYGIVHREFPIIIANLLNFGLNSLVVGAILIHA